MAAAKRFLVINPFGIGDVLFSTSLLRCIKSAYPDCSIYYLCNRKTEPVLAGLETVSGTLVYERDDLVAAQKISLWEWWREFSAFIARMRALNCSIAVDLSLNTQYGFFAWLAGIKDRVGLDYNDRCRFLTRRIAVRGYSDKHVAQYYLDVLSLLDIPVLNTGLEIHVDPVNRGWAQQFMRTHAVGREALIIGIAPCGGDAFGKDAFIKRWPAENFSALINRLTREMSATVFLFAGPKEKKDIEAILGGVLDRDRVFEWTGATLPQTVALLEPCALFIGNDTGPLRFADGLNKKIVALFGPVDEKVYGPYPMQEDRTIVLSKALACRPCYRNFRLSGCSSDRACLRGITVQEVFSAAQKLLGRDDERNPSCLNVT